MWEGRKDGGHRSQTWHPHVDIVEISSSKLGEKFVKDLRAPTDEEIATTAAMQATADHLWEQWINKPLWNALFNHLPKNAERWSP